MKGRWNDAFLTSPIWRFWLGGDVCGCATMGALMPSMDGVGRYFPLTIAAFAQDESTFAPPEADAQDAWFETAEAFLLGTLEQGDHADVLRSFEALAGPHDVPEPSPDPRALRDVPGITALEIAGTRFEDSFAQARLLDPRRTFSSSTFWWTTGGDGFPARAFCAALMPPPHVYTAMLTGEFGEAHVESPIMSEDTGGLDTPFESGAVSHVGLVRTNNEDGVLARPAIGLWAVADGMGGHDAGEFASGAVIAALAALTHEQAHVDLVQACHDAIGQANAAIRRFSDQNGGTTVGTTAAILVAREDRIACLWCGDSRVYRIRRGAISQLSRDHTEVQDYIDRGLLTVEESHSWPGRNVLTRAIGVLDEPELEAYHDDLVGDDAFVICSDGLTGHVDDDEILKIAGRRPAASGCQELIDLALSRGGKDNVTVIVVQYRPDATRRMPRPSLSAPD